MEFIFTSDHGENLGENNKWGHAEITPEVLKVPYLYIASKNSVVREEFKVQRGKLLRHNQIAGFAIRLMGFDIKEENRGQVISSRNYLVVTDLDSQINPREFSPEELN